MTKKLSLVFILTFSLQAALAQAISVDRSNIYNTNNPYYWKNRVPTPGYWQQDVHYKIKAIIDDSVESITGSLQLIYTNNSPDALDEVFFHLYQNAFTPNSYAHLQRMEGKLTTTFGEHEAKGIGTRIDRFAANDAELEYSIDNTILRAKLKSALKPGEQIKFDIEFVTYWDKDDGGNMRRRMKSFDHSGVTHFDGVHWYPRIAVYDRKFGWCKDQHLGKEFYGDFGLFEVELTFPNEYIVEATGELLNESEVLPPALREAIDLKNYQLDRSVITHPVVADGSTKTWKYLANNVHDFAFTADPTYRMSVVEVNGIKCVALAQEQNAARWQKTAQFVADVVALYSYDFGQYAYPKMVAADARDGMEYPMLTLNSGNWPNHRYVIAHEVGHNWFFGMVGNNETYRASLDEGFTQFLTAWSLKKLSNQDFYGNWIDKSSVFSGYLNHALGPNNATLNVHSDYYNSAERHGGGYGQVYYKTATMLYNLQYVLGDDLFLDAMKHYFNQWKFAHPYWEDFRRSIIDYTKVDLNWFFDQWITTNKTIDYGVKSVKHTSKGYAITIERKGGMQMPIDLQVIYSDGSKEEFHIPNTDFIKETKAIVLPKWTGWDMLNPEYSISFSTDKKIKDVVIDPSERLADIYQLDNRRKMPMNTKFSTSEQVYGNHYSLENRWYPNLWYNSIDGIKIGATMHGNYANVKHIYDATIWYNSGLLSSDSGNVRPISYRLSYENSLDHFNYSVRSQCLDGLGRHSLAFSKLVGVTNITIRQQFMYRREATDLSYLIYPEQWNAAMMNSFVDIVLDRNYRGFKHNAQLTVNLRSTSLLSDYSYSYINAEYIHNYPIYKMKLRTRLFGQLGSGSFAPESQLMLAGANAEAMMDSKYVRSRGFIDDNWADFGNEMGHFQYGGGLNIRAFNSYMATSSNESDTFYVYSGNSGASLNMELDFESLLKNTSLHKKVGVNPYLFADAGMLFNGTNHSGLRADAGVGAAMKIKFTARTPLVLRLDMPFFVNRLPYGNTDYFAFRTVFGFSRAF